jgi:hypothetical protein
MPTDQTLAAHASVCARAQEYKESGAFGDDVRMDQCRVAAYLDMLNGITRDVRIASGVLPGTRPSDEPPTDEPPADEPPADEPGACGPCPGEGDCSCRECDGSCSPPPPDDDGPGDDPDDDGPGDDPDDDEPGDAPDGGAPGDAGPRGGPGTGTTAGTSGGQTGGGAGPSVGHGSDAGECGSDDAESDCGPGRERGDSSSGEVRSDDGPGGHRSEGSPGDDRRNAGRTDGSDGGPGDDRGDSGPGDKQGDRDSGGQAGARPVPAFANAPARPADLVVPLATLLGLAERPGEGHGLGPLDPDLCRELAIAAAGSPRSQLCVTVTDPDGIAIGHGCAHPARRGKPPGPAGHGSPASPVRRGPVSEQGLVALPAQLNLTISATRLAELAAATGPPGPGGWKFTRDANRGPAAGGYGTWTLTLPDGRNLTVELKPVPTFECFDHRYESHAYQPSDSLRHLVQIRDGQCTFPPCSRQAKESDFEHATPYDKGGRTCACNAGARSRACHQVKQSKGWNVTQPKPGWHQWTTPSGRVYTQGPKRYPA